MENDLNRQVAAARLSWKVLGFPAITRPARDQPVRKCRLPTELKPGSAQRLKLHLRK